jgi:hypothetical protein
LKIPEPRKVKSFRMDRKTSDDSEKKISRYGSLRLKLGLGPKEIKEEAVTLNVLFTGIPFENPNDAWITLEFDLDTTVEKALKAVLRKYHVKSVYADYMLLRQVRTELEPLPETQKLSFFKFKHLELLYAKPKTKLHFQLPDNSVETFYVDLKIPLINVFSLLKDMLFWDNLDEFVFYSLKDSKGVSFFFLI